MAREQRPKAYGYIRVSTVEQLKGGSPDVQRSTIKAYFDLYLRETHAWGGFFDEGDITSTIPFRQRPAGMRLHAAAGKGDAVVFSKLDRGFRSTRDVANCLLDWIDAGVGVHFLDLRLDTSTYMGRGMALLLATIAEWERERLRERCREGREARRAMGRPIGAPPYGFRLEGKRRMSYLVPNEAERSLGRLIVELKDRQRWSFKAIVAELRARKIAPPRKGRGQQHGTGEISPTVVKRIYHAEKRLRDRERFARIKKELLDVPPQNEL